MKKLVSSEHQKIWFKLKVDGKNDVVLISKKKIGERHPVVYKIEKSSKKTIAPETFNREYRLIYDIPDRPRDRLKDILKDIENLQITIGNNVADFKKYIENTLEDINKSKNSEQIKKLKERIDRYDKLVEDTEEKIKGYENLLKDLELYMAAKFFYRYYEQREKIDYTLAELKNKNRNAKRQHNKYKKIVENFNSLVNYLMNLKNDVLENIEKLNHPDFMIKIVKIKENLRRQILLDIKSKDYDAKLLIIDQILKDTYKLTNNIKKKREILLNEQLKELEITEKLIDLLKDYKNLEIKVPGTDKIIGHYLSELEKSYDDKRIIIEEYKVMEEILKKIKEMRGTLKKDIMQSAEKLKKMLPENGDAIVVPSTDDEIIEEEKTLEEKLNWLDDKLDEYSDKLKKYGIEDISDILMKVQDLESRDYIKEFAELDEDEIAKKINEFTKKIEEYKDDKRKYKVLRDEENKKLEKIENLPEHEYFIYKEYIKILENICSSTERKFKNTFYNYLQYLRSRDVNPNIGNNQDFLRYKEAISSYLGKKMGEIKYTDGVYGVEKVDLLEGIISTKEGKIIRLSDLGTGHMQAAYIQSVLNREDPRKIIALFDEISTMDRKTLKPILKKMRELYRSGKLVACVMVQKREGEVRVTNLEKEDF